MAGTAPGLGLVVAMKDVRSLSRLRGYRRKLSQPPMLASPRATSHAIRARFKAPSAQAETLCDLDYAIRFASSAQ